MKVADKVRKYKKGFPIKMANIYYRRLFEGGLCNSSIRPTDVFSGNDKYYSDVIVNTLNDGRSCYVLVAGHEMSWPSKEVSQRNDRFTIHYIASGNGLFNKTPIGPGACFAVFPGQEYSITNDKTNPLEKYWISLRGPQTTEFITRAHFDRMPSVFRFEQMGKVIDLFNSMIYTEHPDTDLELYLFGCFNILMSYHKPMNVGIEIRSHTNTGHTYYEMAKDFIVKRYNEKLTIKEIAEHVHISESYLRALFLRFEGRPIGEVIIDHKVEAAKSLLATSEYSVSQISGILGYADYSTFSKIFKKKMNCSPTEYRKKSIGRSF